MRRGALGAGPLAALALAACLLALAAGAAPAHAATDPIFAWVPVPPPAWPLSPPYPAPPDGFLNGPCGLAVDTTGNFYVADRYHDFVDVYDGAADYAGSPPVYSSRGHITQRSVSEPCGLAVDSAGRLYVNSYHGAVTRYTPTAYPPATEPPGTKYEEATAIDPGPATGVAVDLATGHVYVNRRAYLNEYDESGSFVRRVGEGTLRGRLRRRGLALPGHGGIPLRPRCRDEHGEGL